MKIDVLFNANEDLSEIVPLFIQTGALSLPLPYLSAPLAVDASSYCEDTTLSSLCFVSPFATTTSTPPTVTSSSPHWMIIVSVGSGVVGIIIIVAALYLVRRRY